MHFRRSTCFVTTEKIPKKGDHSLDRGSNYDPVPNLTGPKDALHNGLFVSSESLQNGPLEMTRKINLTDVLCISPIITPT